MMSARGNMRYGIDLGTTNSAICRMEKGEPAIIKSDTLKDTMPSCVSVNKKGNIRVGDSAYNTMKCDKRHAAFVKQPQNTFFGFVRKLGLGTKYYCPNAGRDFSAGELSAEVLKALKSFVFDEQVNAAVVTVPAKITASRRKATLEAAKLAGIKCCRLLQEPIAASMAYGAGRGGNVKRLEEWMVFNFGVGSFDVALVYAKDGVVQVFDTEEDEYLGENTIEYAIVDKILIPHLKENFAISEILKDSVRKKMLRYSLRNYAEDAKNQLSFSASTDILSNLGDLGNDDDGEELELDLSLTQEQVFAVMRPHFQKAVDICKTLLQRNGLAGTNLTKLILVGGPTHCPLIRQMLREQITENVDTSIDPMTAVAVGAALFASTQPVDAETQEPVAAGTLRLEMTFDATTAEKEEWVTVMLPANSDREKIWVEFVRAGWSSGKIEVDRNGNVVGLQLLELRPNVFEIRAYDASGNAIPCEPHEITILQSLKFGTAVLPYNIGIAVLDVRRGREIFQTIPGLERRNPLPAEGKLKGLRTTVSLHPNVATDKIVIPIYQSADDGHSAVCACHVADIEISGDDVDKFVPAGSAYELTLCVDSSECLSAKVFFPVHAISATKPVNTRMMLSYADLMNLCATVIWEAQAAINALRNTGAPVNDLQKSLDNMKRLTALCDHCSYSPVLVHDVWAGLPAIFRGIDNLENRGNR